MHLLEKVTQKRSKQRRDGEDGLNERPKKRRFSSTRLSNRMVTQAHRNLVETLEKEIRLLRRPNRLAEERLVKVVRVVDEMKSTIDHFQDESSSLGTKFRGFREDKERYCAESVAIRMDGKQQGTAMMIY